MATILGVQFCALSAEKSIETTVIPLKYVSCRRRFLIAMPMAIINHTARNSFELGV